jgi:hypothetical protein
MKQYPTRRNQTEHIETDVLYGTLSGNQKMRIQSVRRAALRADFPELSNGTRELYIEQLADSLTNPNAKSALRRPGQRYGRPRHAIAQLMKGSIQGQLLGHLSVADNVSSELPKAFGSAERFAKLRIPLPPFISHRVAFIGQISISPQGREIIADQAKNHGSTFFDDMLRLAMVDKRPQQPVKVYPFVREGWLKDVLAETGFVQVTNYEGAIHAFGPGPSGMQDLELWKYNSAGALLETLQQPD